MSIDKTVKSDKVELNTKIWFGIFKGSVPAKLIKESNVEGIKYLLWMRTELNEKGFPRFMLSVDLHHILDDLIRRNASLFSGYITKYTETDYSLWLAQKRIQRKKDEIKKEEEARRKREEIFEYQETQRRKDEAVRQRQQEYLLKQQIAIAKQKAEQAEREYAYTTEWAAW